MCWLPVSVSRSILLWRVWVMLGLYSRFKSLVGESRPLQAWTQTNSLPTGVDRVDKYLSKLPSLTQAKMTHSIHSPPSGGKSGHSSNAFCCNMFSPIRRTEAMWMWYSYIQWPSIHTVGNRMLLAASPSYICRFKTPCPPSPSQNLPVSIPSYCHLTHAMPLPSCR